MKNKIVIAAGVVALALTMSACSWESFTEPFKDAPRGKTNEGVADLVTMPDGFSNWATKCDHGNRIYAAYHGEQGPFAAGMVVPQDPTCR